MKIPAEIMAVSQKVYGVLQDLTETPNEMIAVLSIIQTLIQVQAHSEQEQQMQEQQAMMSRRGLL